MIAEQMVPSRREATAMALILDRPIERQAGPPPSPPQPSSTHGPEIDFLHAGIGAHLVRRSVGDDTALRQNRHTVGERKDDVHVVLDDDLGLPALLEPF